MTQEQINKIYETKLSLWRKLMKQFMRIQTQLKT